MLIMFRTRTFAKCIDVIDVEKRIKSGQDLNSLVFLVVGGFPAIGILNLTRGGIIENHP